MAKNKRTKLLLLSVQNIERLLEGLIKGEQEGTTKEFSLCANKDNVRKDSPTLGQRKEIDIMQVDPNDTLYTIQEAIDYLGISRSTLDNHRAEGYLTNVKKGRAVRLIRRELEMLKKLYSVPKGKV